MYFVLQEYTYYGTICYSKYANWILEINYKIYILLYFCVRYDEVKPQTYSRKRGRELIIYRSLDSMGSKGVVDYKTGKALKPPQRHDGCRTNAC